MVKRNEDFYDSLRRAEAAEKAYNECVSCDHKNKPHGKRVILSFVLTQILVPLLFVGTCFPLGLAILDQRGGYALILVYVIVFIIAVGKAKKTVKSGGVKLALIKFFSLIALTAIGLWILSFVIDAFKF